MAPTRFDGVGNRWLNILFAAGDQDENLTAEIIFKRSSLRSVRIRSLNLMGFGGQTVCIDNGMLVLPA
jgi:hypothetical protein